METLGKTRKDCYNQHRTTGTKAATLGQLNPLRYRSYVYDKETGLYYVSSRYYDSEIGRWINVDGLVSTDQGLLSNNMFVYCLNNPVNYVDCNGEAPLKVSRYLLTKWVLGKGKRLKLNKSSCVSRALKNSKTMKAKIMDEIEKYEKGEFTGTGAVKFTSKEPDLWLGVRRAHYEVSIKKETKTTGIWRWKKTKTRYVVSVKVWDKYDFNKGDEKGDGLGSLLNNLGYYAQQQKIGTEYYWEANYVYKTKWK